MPKITEQDVRAAYRKHLKREPTRAEIDRHRGQTVPDVAKAVAAFFKQGEPAPQKLPPKPPKNFAGAFTNDPGPAWTPEVNQADWWAQKIVRDLGYDPSKATAGLKAARQLLEQGMDPALVKVAVAAQHPEEIAARWLQTPQKREELRKMLRDEAQAFDARDIAAAGQTQGGGNEGSAGPPIPQELLRNMTRVPVPFIRPDLLVSREDVDTPEELSRFLQTHKRDDPVTRALMQGALDWGGLSLEPTPFGKTQIVGGGLEWKRRGHEPGELEQAALSRNRPLTPQELSAIAQERIGQWRVHDPKALQRTIAQLVNAGVFATAGGLAAGPIFGAAAAGTGLASGAGGAGVAGVASGIGGGAAGGAIGGGVSSGGDLDAILMGALTGGVGGGLGATLPQATSASTGALRGAGISGATNLAGQLAGSGDIDWQRLAQALGTGAATGGLAAGTKGDLSPGAQFLTKFGAQTAGGLSNLFAADDPLAEVNAQMDRAALDRETASQDALQRAQEEWKAQYAAARAEAESAAWEKFNAAKAAAQARAREAQTVAQAAAQARAREQFDQFEARKGEWEAQRAAFMAAREDQVRQALEQMQLAQPDITALMRERQASIAEAQAEQEAAEATLRTSREFFPSAVLEQSPGTGEFPQTDSLVPHSPPAVLFGASEFPLSRSEYATGAEALPFSAEGFLPSGLVSAAPSAPASRATVRRPGFLNALARHPYLRV